MAMALPLSSQPQTGCLHSSRTSSHNIRSCTRIGPPFMPAELRATRHGSRRSICRDRRQPPLIVAPQSTSSSVAGDQPAELLAAIASLRRQGGGPEAKDTVIRCVEALEEQGVDAPISGRWTLVYSTQQANRERQTEWDRKAGPPHTLQAVTNRLYKLFFRFAPALAGSQDTGGAKDIRNEQIVDLDAGEVDNIVEVRLPWSKDASLRVRVWGEVEVDDGVPGGNSLAVTFGGWSFSLISPGQQAAQEIKLPLPRPRGTLAVTYCDESLRISRGGRGGIFVTSRAPDLSEPTG